MPATARILARHDAKVTAVLREMRPLTYRAEAAPGHDLPGHARAASALRRHGGRIVVVQDDVNALVVVNPDDGSMRSVLLPAGDAGALSFDDRRGNKQFKMDLEASLVLPDGRLVALGSGSSPRRERIVVLSAEADTVRVVEASTFYAGLRMLAEARGAELNLEGAAVQGDRLWLVQRGHGKRRTTQWNALLELDLAAFLAVLEEKRAPPGVRSMFSVEIGASDTGAPFGFTDVAIAATGHLAFLACAEDSPDVRTDGPVHGCRFGWIDTEAREGSFTDVHAADGRPCTLKLEGLEARPGVPGLYDVVADVDRAEEPAILAELHVTPSR